MTLLVAALQITVSLLYVCKYLKNAPLNYITGPVQQRSIIQPEMDITVCKRGGVMSVCLSIRLHHVHDLVCLVTAPPFQEAILAWHKKPV